MAHEGALEIPAGPERAYLNLALWALVWSLLLIHYPLKTGLADADLWGHLAAGRLMHETLDVPRLDDFSFSARGAAWVSHEWLFQFGAYRLYRLLGPPGLMAVRWLVWASTLFLAFRIVRRHASSFSARLSCFALTGTALSFGFNHRPQILTYLGCALMLESLGACSSVPSEGLGHRPRARMRGVVRESGLAWLLIPWSWLHGGFLAGAGVLILYILGACLTGGWRERRIPILGLSTLFALSATLFNPYGLGLWIRLFETLTMSGPKLLVWEWQSVRRTPFLLFKGLTVGYGAAVAAAWALRKRGGETPALEAPHWLWAAGGISAACFSIRHLPLAALLCAAPVARLMDALRGFSAKLRPLPAGDLRVLRVFRTAAGAAVLILVLGALSGWSTGRRGIPWGAIRIQGQGDFAAGGGEFIFPEGAVRHLSGKGLSGRLWAPYEAGSYLSWRLYPSCRVFIDPRMEHVYPDFVLLDYMRVLKLEPGWQETLRRWNPDLILWPPEHPVSKELPLLGYSVLYRDPDYALWGRARSASKRMPGRAFGGSFASLAIPETPRAPLPWLFP